MYLALSVSASSSALATMVLALYLASVRIASFIFLIRSSILPETIVTYLEIINQKLWNSYPMKFITFYEVL